MVVRLALVIAVAVGNTGCRQILGFEDPADEPDAAPLGPWGVARRVDALSQAGAGDLTPALRSDGLEVYFATTRADMIDDIWRSTRNTLSDTWSPPTAVSNLNLPSPSNELVPKLSSDGLTMYLSRGGTTDFDIFVSTRSAVTALDWSTPALVAALDSSNSNYPGNTDASETHMVFSSDRTAVNDVDMYEITRDSASDAWSMSRIENVGGLLNLVGRNEYAGHLSADGKTLYFYSDRLSPPNYELYVTTRPSIDAAFEAPTLITELQTLAAETHPTVSGDQRYMMFARGSVSDVNTFELYETSR
ncbi:MAG: hypothetical protein AB7O24_23360 [Kofleriaceae bacterium]